MTFETALKQMTKIRGFTEGTDTEIITDISRLRNSKFEFILRLSSVWLNKPGLNLSGQI